MTPIKNDDAVEAKPCPKCGALLPFYKGKVLAGGHVRGLQPGDPVCGYPEPEPGSWVERMNRWMDKGTIQ